MSYILSLCDKSYMAQIFLIIKTLLKLLCYVLPVVIIIASSIGFLKAIKSGKHEDLKENGVLLIKRIIAGLVIVLLPTVMNYVFTSLINTSEVDLLACLESASAEKVAQLKAKEEAAAKAEKEAQAKEDEKILKEAYEEEQKEREQNREAWEASKNKKVKNLNYIAQGNYSNLSFCSGSSTVANSGCGAAAFAMISSSYSDPKYGMEYVASWFCKNKYSLANGALRADAILASDTLEHFGLEGGVLFGNGEYSGSKYNESYGNAVLKAVQEGKSVIIGIPMHWVVAGPNENCSTNQVYLYDSGFPSRNGCYTPSQLFHVTYNSRSHCAKEGVCGWDIGIVLS